MSRTSDNNNKDQDKNLKNGSYQNEESGSQRISHAGSSRQSRERDEEKCFTSDDHYYHSVANHPGCSD